PEILLKTYFNETELPAEESAAEKDRMFAAIVPHGSQFWFFKLVGPSDLVRRESDSFAAQIASIHFGSDDSSPKWTLPEGWRELPASGSGPAERFATLQIGSGEKPLEVTVTSLPRQPDEDDNEAKLMNVNRWRRQMSLGPIEQLSGAIRERKTADGGPAYVLGLTGKYQTGGMSHPPATGGDQPELPEGHPAISQAAQPAEPASQPAESANAEFKFATPAGWQPGKSGEMRKAAFVVQDGGKSVEITVVTLPPFAADIAANVNRWRGQLKLPAADEKEIASTVKAIQIGDAAGSFVELLGPKDSSPQQAILGAIAPRGDQVWFITLRGDAELAQREKPHFEAFVKSIQFGSPK
ncbi:MAG TPA: hypothetical protein VG056_11670, partial [Pirellulales bacterium]|nr:hypothetical protein [Pirellulales bacterium]